MTVDSTSQANLADSRFLKACRREPTDCTPIWLMRQAGRYMANYRAIRAEYSMLEVINSPKLSAEVTLQPIEAFDLDAAIIFSDILPPLVGMGLDLEFEKGSGPVIKNPITSPDQVGKLVSRLASETMGPTIEAVSLVSKELTPRGIPLIGFAGAPFTLACYAIQGRGSKMYEKPKQFMYSHPEAWADLMNRFVDVDADYLIQQVRAGASALQVFDSWAGVLSEADYCRFIQPYNTRLLSLLAETGVPLINFSTGTGGHLHEVSACGGDVIGVDWRMSLAKSWESAGTELAIQGNLDPTTLLSSWAEIKRQTDSILQDAAGRPGHIFNVGHGIMPPTPVESVKSLVDYVHDSTTDRNC